MPAPAAQGVLGSMPAAHTQGHKHSRRRLTGRLLKSLWPLTSAADSSSSSRSGGRRRLLAPQKAQAAQAPQATKGKDAAEQYRPPRYGGGYGPYGPSSYGGTTSAYSGGGGSRSSYGGSGSNAWADATGGGGNRGIGATPWWGGRRMLL